MAIYGATLAFARSLGALMSGFIADNLGYDWNFFVSTVISVIAGLLVVGGWGDEEDSSGKAQPSPFRFGSEPVAIN